MCYIPPGGTAGVILVRKITATAQKLTTAGVFGNLADASRDFGDAVGEGMAEREAELREGLGLTEGLADTGDVK